MIYTADDFIHEWRLKHLEWELQPIFDEYFGKSRFVVVPRLNQIIKTSIGICNIKVLLKVDVQEAKTLHIFNYTAIKENVEAIIRYIRQIHSHNLLKSLMTDLNNMSCSPLFEPRVRSNVNPRYDSLIEIDNNAIVYDDGTTATIYLRISDELLAQLYHMLFLDISIKTPSLYLLALDIKREIQHILDNRIGKNECRADGIYGAGLFEIIISTIGTTYIIIKDYDKIKKNIPIILEDIHNITHNLSEILRKRVLKRGSEIRHEILKQEQKLIDKDLLDKSNKEPEILEPTRIFELSKDQIHEMTNGSYTTTKTSGPLSDELSDKQRAAHLQQPTVSSSD